MNGSAATDKWDFKSSLVSIAVLETVSAVDPSSPAGTGKPLDIERSMYVDML